MQNRIWTIFTLCRCPVAIQLLILTEKFILNSDFTTVPPIIGIKNIDEIFLKMADQSYLVKTVLILHNKCSQLIFHTTMLIEHILYHCIIDGTSS